MRLHTENRLLLQSLPQYWRIQMWYSVWGHHLANLLSFSRQKLIYWLILFCQCSLAIVQGYFISTLSLIF